MEIITIIAHLNLILFEHFLAFMRKQFFSKDFIIIIEVNYLVYESIFIVLHVVVGS